MAAVIPPMPAPRLMKSNSISVAAMLRRTLHTRQYARTFVIGISVTVRTFRAASRCFLATAPRCCYATPSRALCDRLTGRQIGHQSEGPHGDQGNAASGGDQHRRGDARHELWD